MTPVKMTTSVLGQSIVNDIESFIKTNADAAAKADSASPDDGAKALANAIAYGIAKALASASVQSACVAGVDPVTGAPIGNLIFSVLKLQTIEA